MRQRITNNGAPSALGDRHCHGARDRARRGLLVADTRCEREEVFDESEVGRGAGRNAVCDGLAGLDGEGDGGLVGVRDSRHGDVPAEETLWFQRNYQVCGASALSGGLVPGVRGAGDKEGWCAVIVGGWQIGEVWDLGLEVGFLDGLSGVVA